MLLSDFRFTIFNNDKRSDQPSSIRCYINSILLVIGVDTHKFLNPSSFSQKSEIFDELMWVCVNTNRLTIQVNHKILRRVKLMASNKISIFHSKINCNSMEGLFWGISSYMSCQCKIFNQTARLSFWCI